MRRQVHFASQAFEDFTTWTTLDPKVYGRIVELLRDIDRTPFKGLGKPEPLKHELQGYWSRRITHEHRLVYQVTETAIVVLSCKRHYRLS